MPPCIPDAEIHTVTSDGLPHGPALLFLRILRPNWPALLEESDPIRRPLRRAFLKLEAEIERICEDVHLRAIA